MRYVRPSSVSITASRTRRASDILFFDFFELSHICYLSRLTVRILEKWGKKGAMRIFSDPNARPRVSAAAQSGGLLNTALFYALDSIYCEHTAWLRRGVGCDRALAQPQLCQPDTANDACAEAMLILFHGNLSSILLHHFGS